MTENFRAACFDLDGTLVDTEPIHVEAERQTLLHFGKEPAADHPRNFGIGVEAGMTTLAAFYGLGDPQRVLAAYVPLWEQLLHERLKTLPGAQELLTAMGDASIPLALVTSGDDEYAQLVLNRVGIAGRFVFTVTGDDVSQMKPSPEPYLLAAERFGLQPGQVLVFEDSAAGVASAVAAGMFCVAVAADVHERPELDAAQQHITSLTEFGPPEVQRLFETGDEDAVWLF
jgi:HAD superfamily hydrolase (TIGR01509 family)